MIGKEMGQLPVADRRLRPAQCAGCAHQLHRNPSCLRLGTAGVGDALRIAERSGDDVALDLARAALGTALVHRHADAEPSSGQKLLAEASEALLRRVQNRSELPIFEVYSARERARRGLR